MPDAFTKHWLLGIVGEDGFREIRRRVQFDNVPWPMCYEIHRTERSVDMAEWFDTANLVGVTNPNQGLGVIFAETNGCAGTKVEVTYVRVAELLAKYQHVSNQLAKSTRELDDLIRANVELASAFVSKESNDSLFVVWNDREQLSELAGLYDDSHILIRAGHLREMLFPEWHPPCDPTPAGKKLWASDGEEVWEIHGDGNPISRYARRVKWWAEKKLPDPPPGSTTMSADRGQGPAADPQGSQSPGPVKEEDMTNPVPGWPQHSYAAGCQKPLTACPAPPPAPRSIESAMSDLSNAVEKMASFVDELQKRFEDVLVPGGQTPNCPDDPPAKCNLAHRISSLASVLRSATTRIEETISRCEL